MQLIDKQRLIFCHENTWYKFEKPYYLYDLKLRLIKATVRGSTLGWNINGKFVSINKIKSYAETNTILQSDVVHSAGTSASASIATRCS